MFGTYEYDGHAVQKVASYPQEGETTIRFIGGERDGEKATVPTHELEVIDHGTTTV